MSGDSCLPLPGESAVGGVPYYSIIIMVAVLSQLSDVIMETESEKPIFYLCYSSRLHPLSSEL